MQAGAARARTGIDQHDLRPCLPRDAQRVQHFLFRTASAQGHGPAGLRGPCHQLAQHLARQRRRAANQLIDRRGATHDHDRHGGSVNAARQRRGAARRSRATSRNRGPGRAKSPASPAAGAADATRAPVPRRWRRAVRCRGRATDRSPRAGRASCGVVGKMQDAAVEHDQGNVVGARGPQAGDEGTGVIAADRVDVVAAPAWGGTGIRGHGAGLRALQDQDGHVTDSSAGVRSGHDREWGRKGTIRVRRGPHKFPI